MALSANSVWEVRTTGNATNGGGFVAGAAGTDYSQQDAKNTVGNNISTTDAVAVGTAVITSATATITAAIVGNIVYLQGGSGALAAGWYQVVSQAGDGVTFTVDRNVAAGTGITLNIGGALATLAGLAAVMVSSNKAFVKTGAGYSTTATITFGAASITPSNSVPFTRLIGYTTTRGDNGKAVLTLSTNTGLIGLSFSNDGWMVENMTVNCASLGTSVGIKMNGNFCQVRQCKVQNFSSEGISAAAIHAQIVDNEVTGGVSPAVNAITTGTNTIVRRNYIHDNVSVGIAGANAFPCIEWNIIANCTGASSDGIQVGSTSCLVSNNTVYGSGRHGILITSNNAIINTAIRNNLLVGNGGYGVQLNASGNPALPQWDGNAFYNNTSGTRNNMDSTTGINGVAPYTNVLDVVLSADPFTNAAGNDFSLNNTAGGGAAARAAGTPGAFSGSAVVGYIDMGAAQHADPASSGGSAVAIFGG